MQRAQTAACQRSRIVLTEDTNLAAMYAAIVHPIYDREGNIAGYPARRRWAKTFSAPYWPKPVSAPTQSRRLRFRLIRTHRHMAVVYSAGFLRL
jgi:hypothetical protein